jgi:transcriptional regulator, merR family
MRRALLEIDWQNWILDLAHDPWSAHLARELRRLLANLGWPVVSTRYLSPEPGDDRADPEHRDAAFVDGFEPRGQPVVTKYSRDIFDVTQTDEVLRSLGVDQLVLTGLVTSHGIRLAATSAQERGYAVTVVSNACADTSREAHLTALDELRGLGITVCSADELAASAWQQAGDVTVGIAEVADITGLSRDTLRWYEREGLIPSIDRTSNGYRRYDGRAVRMIQMLVRLRRTGLPVEQMREYIALVAEGESSHRRRLAILQRHRDVVQQQLDQLADDLGVLDHKITNYQRALGE